MHGEPDWPAIARPAVERTARVLEATGRRRLLVVHVGVAWRESRPEMNLTAPIFARAPDRSVEGRGNPSSTNRSDLPQRDRRLQAERERPGGSRARPPPSSQRRRIPSPGRRGDPLRGGRDRREAVDRGSRVVVEDCCGSRAKEVHDHSIERHPPEPLPHHYRRGIHPGAGRSERVAADRERRTRSGRLTRLGLTPRGDPFPGKCVRMCPWRGSRRQTRQPISPFL